MNLTKQQRAQRQNQFQQAIIAALREHFTGEGATSRSLRFLCGALMASAGWSAKLMFVVSWGVISGLLVGPEHDFFLKQLHAWMVATPVDQVLGQGHAMLLAALVLCVKCGSLLGFGQKLMSLVIPVAQRVEPSFANVTSRGAKSGPY